MTDLVSDLLLAVVAVTMLVLALEVHGLPKKINASIPLSIQKRTPLAAEPEMSEADRYLKQFSATTSESKPDEEVKPPPIPVSKIELSKEVEKQKPIVAGSPEQPFSMEDFVDES